MLFAETGMAMPLALSDWLSLASFQLLAFVAVVYLMYKPAVTTKTRLGFLTLAAVASVFIFILLSLTTTLIPGFTISIQEGILLYLSPYFIALPFIAVGFGNQLGTRGKIAPLFWIAPLAALEVYALFSNSLIGLDLWIRTPDFICVPAAILTAVGVYWLSERIKGVHLRKLLKPAIAAIVVAIAVTSCYTMYATVSLQDRNMGYHWLYSTQELQAGTWIVTNNGNQTVTGDAKVFYLIHDYFGVDTAQSQGFRYLNGDDPKQPNILFTYDQMYQNGYVLGFHGLELPESWTEKTAHMDRVYTNNQAEVYVGVDLP